MRYPYSLIILKNKLSINIESLYFPDITKKGVFFEIY